MATPPEQRDRDTKALLNPPSLAAAAVLPVALPSEVKAVVLSKKTTLELILPVLALVTAYLIFSLYNVIVKKALNDGTNPLVLAFIREIIATSILLPVAYFTERRKGPLGNFWPRREDLPLFIGLGMVMVWAVQLLSALALSQLTATTYSMLAPVVPPCTLAVALLSGYEPFKKKDLLSWLKVVAVALAAGGALYIAVAAANNSSSSSTSKNVWVGMLFLLTNKVSVGSYPVIEKRLLKQYPPLMIVSWGYTFGCIATLLSVVPIAVDPNAWKLSTSGLGAIAYSSILSSSVNYSLLIYANKRTSPLFVMTLYPLQSVFTPLLSQAILGSGLTAGDAVGGSIIVSALAVCVFVRWKEGKMRDAAAAAAAEKEAADGRYIELGQQQQQQEAGGKPPGVTVVGGGRDGEAEPYTPVYGQDAMGSPFPLGNGVAGSMDEMGVADEAQQELRATARGGLSSRA